VGAGTPAAPAAATFMRLRKKSAKSTFAFRGSTGSVMRTNHSRSTRLGSHMEGGG